MCWSLRRLSISHDRHRSRERFCAPPVVQFTRGQRCRGSGRGSGPTGRETVQPRPADVEQRLLRRVQQSRPGCRVYGAEKRDRGNGYGRGVVYRDEVWRDVGHGRLRQHHPPVCRLWEATRLVVRDSGQFSYTSAVQLINWLIDFDTVVSQSSNQSTAIIQNRGTNLLSQKDAFSTQTLPLIDWFPY